MDHKHFQSAKTPFSVIFNSKPTNQVIRYKHEGQVSAKIMLEQKACHSYHVYFFCYAVPNFVLSLICCRICQL